MPYICFRLRDRTGGNKKVGDIVNVYDDKIVFSDTMLSEFGFVFCPDLPEWAIEQLKEPLTDLILRDSENKPLVIGYRNLSLRKAEVDAKLPELLAKIQSTYSYKEYVAQTDIIEILWKDLSELFYDKTDKDVKSLTESVAPGL